MEISRKWLGGGATDVLAPGGTRSPKVLGHPNPVLHRCHSFFAPMQEASGALGPKHFLHPLLTTFAKFPFSGPLPEPWGLGVATLWFSIMPDCHLNRGCLLGTADIGLRWEWSLSKEVPDFMWLMSVSLIGHSRDDAGICPSLSFLTLLFWNSLFSPARNSFFWACKNWPLGCRKWGCNKWGLKGCLAGFPGNRPKSAFSPLFCLFRPFPEGAKSTWEIQNYLRKKAFFLRYPRICLNPHFLNPHLRPSKTPSGLNEASERDFWKTNLPFSRLVKVLHLRGENCLQNTQFYKQKGPCLKTPFTGPGQFFHSWFLFERFFHYFPGILGVW